VSSIEGIVPPGKGGRRSIGCSSVAAQFPLLEQSRCPVNIVSWCSQNFRDKNGLSKFADWYFVYGEVNRTGEFFALKCDSRFKPV